MNIRREFTVHMLNETGKQKARQIAETLTEALDKLEQVCGTDGREMALVRTKLEELSFFAKKAMAVRSENQEPA